MFLFLFLFLLFYYYNYFFIILFINYFILFFKNKKKIKKDLLLHNENFANLMKFSLVAKIFRYGPTICLLILFRS